MPAQNQSSATTTTLAVRENATTRLKIKKAKSVKPNTDGRSEAPLTIWQVACAWKKAIGRSPQGSHQDALFITFAYVQKLCSMAIFHYVISALVLLPYITVIFAFLMTACAVIYMIARPETMIAIPIFLVQLIPWYVEHAVYRMWSYCEAKLNGSSLSTASTPNAPPVLVMLGHATYQYISSGVRARAAS